MGAQRQNLSRSVILSFRSWTSGNPVFLREDILLSSMENSCFFIYFIPPYYLPSSCARLVKLKIGQPTLEGIEIIEVEMCTNPDPKLKCSKEFS